MIRCDSCRVPIVPGRQEVAVREGHEVVSLCRCCAGIELEQLERADTEPPPAPEAT